MQRVPSDLERKIDYLFNNEKGRQLLDNILNYLTPLLADLSERRLSLPFASILLSMVISGEYAAERAIGRPPEESMESALSSLHEVCLTTEKILRENFESGELERLYESLLQEISSSGVKGSEQAPESTE